MDQNGLDPASLYERQVIPYRGVSPRLHSTVFIAPGAYIIGNVTIGENSSVWFNAVIRGDVHYIEIGAGVNIQDLCMLHVTHDTYPLTVGNEVTVGHGAVLHGCTVSDNVLVGMRATVLDGATIGSYSLIAAGSLVREGLLSRREYSLRAYLPASSENCVRRNGADSYSPRRIISTTFAPIQTNKGKFI
jgi:gamma-carbonic anhydrase